MLAFNSDSDVSGAAFASAGYPTVIVEPVGAYECSFYLDPTMQAAGFRLYFQSDGVPEPGTVALLLVSGLSAGMVALRRNRKK